jgi:hypothetical protein
MQKCKKLKRREAHLPRLLWVRHDSWVEGPSILYAAQLVYRWWRSNSVQRLARHSASPRGTSTRDVNYLCCRRRPRVHAMLKSEERTISWPYNTVDWPITSICHADWHAGTNMNGEMLTCRTAIGPERGEVTTIFGLTYIRSELALWGIGYPTFQMSCITSNKGMWARGKEPGDLKQNIPPTRARHGRESAQGSRFVAGDGKSDDGRRGCVEDKEVRVRRGSLSQWRLLSHLLLPPITNTCL